MLVGIGFLILVLVVAALIAVDVIRTPSDPPTGHADRHVPEPEWAITGVRGGSAVQASAAEPAARETPVPAASAGVRRRAGPVEMDSFDQMRREMSQSAASEAAFRAKFNAMYGNLSRRSQALVERQLRIIESLERGEQDQQRLASLSKLGRIAMRMHRNSQNLLVLAGQEAGTGWNQPVTLAHVLEAALAEIEDYQRVSSEVQPGIALRGPAVHDAVHVLVELIDNATSFSSAEMPVHITGRILTTGGALVDITDAGIGMPAREMAIANQQLDNPPPPDIDVPKWMGLLVVARLAARHGIRVRLNQAESGGLTALVWFPDEILTHYSAGAGLGQPAAQQRRAAVSPAAYVPARTNPDPGWSARSAQGPVPAESPAAARPADLSIVVSHAENHVSTSGPPIYDKVESHWSRGSREASTSAGLATAPAPPAARLPRRPSSATQGSRGVLGTPSGPPNGPGRPGRAAAAEETKSVGQDES